jgi:hypothetical protein
MTDNAGKRIWWALIAERGILLLLVAVYLIMLNQELPHGDALRIVRQIEQGSLVWNPNHLLFDPFGYAAHKLRSVLEIPGGALGTFELISALATLLSIYLFHAILIRAGVASLPVRMLATIGLFASGSFLTVAVSQYFFMVQMPFLLYALYLYLIVRTDQSLSARRVNVYLYAQGVALGLATAIMFSNVLLLLMWGLVVAWVPNSQLRWRYGNSVRLWFGAAVVCIPAFLIGHWLSKSTASLPSWIVSYQGDADSKLNALYGLKLTVEGVAGSAAMALYKLGGGAAVEAAGLGTILRGLVGSKALEFNPDYLKLALSLVALPLALAMHCQALLLLARNFMRSALALMLAGWIVAYSLFAFLWAAGDNIFWFQILPVIWLCVAIPGGQSADGIQRSLSVKPRNQWKVATQLGATAVVLLLVNSFNVVIPGSSRQFSQRQLEHQALLQDGDLEIVTGWDQYKWITSTAKSTSVSRILLMNEAVSKEGTEQVLIRLPEIVGEHLAGGKRVIVARVFDLDSDPMPWAALNEMGWPRARLKSVLAGFCTVPIGKVADVTFRQLLVCPAS